MSYPGKGKADYLALGDNNAVCFECGRKFKASTMVRHWQGYYLCKQHWNPRQPQDFVRAKPDVQTPPWVQPMPADVFASLHYTEYLNEVENLTEDRTSTVGKRFADSITSSETFIVSRSHLENEVITGSESLAVSIDQALADSLTLTETNDVEANIEPVGDEDTITESNAIFFNKVFPAPSSILVLGNVVNDSAVDGSTGTIFDDSGYSDEDIDVFESLVFDGSHSLVDIGTFTETFLVAKEVIYSDTFGPLSEVTSTFFDKQLPGVYLTAITGNVLNSSAVNGTSGMEVPAELMGLSELFEFVGDYSLSDSGSLSEGIVIDYGAEVTEVISSSETLYIDHATLSDIATLNETAQYSMNKGSAETVALTESLHSVWNPSRPLNRFRLNTYSLG